MKRVDMRNLQHHLGRYLDEVEAGETIEVRRRKRVIARIVPSPELSPAEPWPDLDARLAEAFEAPLTSPEAERTILDGRD